MLYLDKYDFKDHHDRIVMLRGVNLGGNSKTPMNPTGATHLKAHFYDYQNISFIGRPFPLSEADEHFSRLRHWGFNCLRLLVTWEAIEHAGPGLYDFAYLEYLQKIVEKAGQYDFTLFIDPHQDVWSRWSGGDGAPAWTLEAVGFDITKLHETGAAFLHQEAGDPFPCMRWVTNYDKLAAATLFTLFFGGNDFASKTFIEGVPIQEFLQSRYIEAYKKVASLLKDIPHVLGYGTLNEPSAGWIGRADLNDPRALFPDGPTPTPFQSILLGAGIPQEVAVVKMGLTGRRVLRKEIINPKGVSAWREGKKDIWHENGLWELSAQQKPLLTKPHHFSELNGRSVDFSNDYFRPFIARFAQEIRTIHPQAIIFVEEALEKEMPQIQLPNAVNANHWYDAFLLFKRRYLSFVAINSLSKKPLFGSRAIRKSFAAQLNHIKKHSGCEKVGGPTLLGEFGIPYDMDDKIGFSAGDFSPHLAAMNRTWQAIEANMLSGTLWNYTSDNSNRHGDGWNGEDFSIFSRDQIGALDTPNDLDAGGRAVGAFMRPFPRATAGEAITLAFDSQTAAFTYIFKHDPTIKAPTEIYVPKFHYSIGIDIQISDGSYQYDAERQILIYYHSVDCPTHTIRLFRKRKPTACTLCNYSLEKSYVKANGLTFHVVQCGPVGGRPLLLLHGFPEFWYAWREQIPYLVQKGYRLIIPDQRGYNLTDKPSGVEAYRPDLLIGDVVELLDTLGHQKASIIGHACGGWVAWQAAAKYPERFEKAIVLNALHPQMDGDSSHLSNWATTLFRIPRLPEIALQAANWSLLAKLMQIVLGRSDTFSSEDLSLYRKAWEQPGAIKSMLHWYRGMHRYRQAITNSAVKVPLLLIWGGKNKASARKKVRPCIERYTTNGQSIFIEEASHFVQHDEPIRVNGYIDRFLSSS